MTKTFVFFIICHPFSSLSLLLQKKSPKMSSKNEDGTKATSAAPFSKTNSEEQDKLLLEPMLYLMQVPSKNIRKKLLHSFNLWTKVSHDKVDSIAEIVQLLHNASLLLDDIEDNSTLRRGIPAAHKIYGRLRDFETECCVTFCHLQGCQLSILPITPCLLHWKGSWI